MATELAQKWRFVDSPPLGAKENMAIDESLLLTCRGEPVFRLYSWEKDSFTIGRFQKIEDVKEWQKYGKNWAKRATGGGLLLHGFDISYSMVVPIELLGKKSVKESYEYLCQFLLNFYKSLGLKTNWAKDIYADSLSHSPFCQEGFEAYDIIIEGKKIGGNAQKRTKNLILQHGSIPLKPDNRTHAGHSLEELGIKLPPKEAKNLLKESFCKTYGVLFS